MNFFDVFIKIFKKNIFKKNYIKTLKIPSFLLIKFKKNWFFNKKSTEFN